MLVSVTEYRTASGDTATSDAEIDASLSHVQAMVEAFLDRLLGAQAHTEVFTFVSPEPLLLRQWPVTTLTSLDKDGTAVDVTEVVVDKARGILHHRNLLNWAEQVTVTYTAGYATCPPDLKAVIVSLTTARLAGELDVNGPASARGVKKDTVYGVSAIEYDPSPLAKAQLDFYPELGPYVRVLERYQRAYEVAL